MRTVKIVLSMDTMGATCSGRQRGREEEYQVRMAEGSRLCGVDAVHSVEIFGCPAVA